ncbi:glycoside hydrolase superfamily [Parasitella parasitica]|nr:glycoside hydrolase superfamily [Parasitella parasitica]
MFFKSMIFACCLVYNAIAASSPFYGLNYGVNKDSCPTFDTVKRDFRTLSQYTNTVRVYSIKDCQIGQLALQASQESKMKIYLGMWIDKTDSFEEEYAALQKLASSNSFYNVEAIIVGSEVMYREDMSSDQLVKHINKVKNLVGPKGVKVTTSEVYYKFYPDIVDAVDLLMMNAFIYWEGEHISNAVDKLKQHFLTVKSVSKGKVVRISETGWPDQGEQVKDSVSLPENQKDFLFKALCMTRTLGIEMIWFSAIDELYKPGVEGHFGLLDSNRRLKPFYQYEDFMNPCVFS